MADAGIALHVLQEILGHQSVETTKGYLHPDHRHLAEAARQANQFLSVAPHQKGHHPPRRTPSMTASEPRSDPSRRGRSTGVRGFWSTPRAPIGALRGRRHRTGLVHFGGDPFEQIGRVDQAVTTSRYDEALVKVTSHQGFLSG